MVSEKPIVFLFSGQGSQYYPMGHELFANEPHFKQIMLELDQTVVRITGESIVECLYNSKNRGDFIEIGKTHPHSL